MASSLQSQNPSEQNVSQTGLSGPLASRALFWRPRFIREGALALHVPFGFWLTDVLRPTRMMAVGLTDGQMYFAVCQALDKLNVPSMCTGFGSWEQTVPEAEDHQVPTKLREHNRENYADVSTLRWRGAVAALKPVDDFTVDLLIVNMTADLGDVDLFFQLACRKLSTKGIILIHDLQVRHTDTEKGTVLEALMAAHPVIRFGDDDDGLVALLIGAEQDERLRHMSAMKFGSAELNAVQVIFRQLGAGHYFEWQSIRDARLAHEAQTFAEQSAAERDDINQKYTALKVAYEERSRTIATEQRLA